MKILIANLGSTSLKYRLFEFRDGAELALAQGGRERVEDYGRAIDDCLEELRTAGRLAAPESLAAVGFKTVLAEGMTGCRRIDDRVLQALEAGNPVAPAHNPPYLTGIRLFAERLPAVPLVALFETAFYQWAPEPATRYAVPRKWHESGVRRQGFHGASHKYVAERSAALLDREDVARRARRLYVDGGDTKVAKPELRVISCHLGGSSSITGIRDGVAIGNSMGFSPQSGVPQNNRVGDLDPFAVLHAMRRWNLSVEEVERELCYEAGLKGLSGGWNDVRDIQRENAAGNGAAQLALDCFVYEIRRWMGSWHLLLNGADALVFTAGIGENRGELRERICENLDGLGIRLDPAKNRAARGEESEIGDPAAPVRIFVIPANEELVVAREVKRYLEHND